ncbi:MAG: bifunctional metallophosphatase/5'-nucleotidase, partial [Pseudomonadota bacterium]
MEEELELEAAPYTLQILHTSDQEAGVPALTDIIGFSAVLNSLDGNFTNSLKLSSGDLFIAGPIFSASQDVYEEGEPGYADILIQNLIGWDAAAVGNHEFDAGAEAFFNLVAPNSETTNGELGGVGIGPNGYLGTLYPYLATNLDYSAAELPEGVNVVEGGQAPEANSLTSSVIINVNGEEIGVLGTVTPYLESIANTDEVIVTTGDEITATTPIDEQVDAIKQNIAPEVQALTDAGVNK